MISNEEKLTLVRASKDLTPLELIEATCEACKATFINSDVARKEREACAKVADSHMDGTPEWNSAANNIAASIRARGQV
jgi:hypothetical protein